MGRLAPAYQPRKPTATVIYRVVRETLETFLAHTRETYTAPLPRYVERELRGYLRCACSPMDSHDVTATRAATTCSWPFRARVDDETRAGPKGREQGAEGRLERSQHRLQARASRPRLRCVFRATRAPVPSGRGGAVRAQSERSDARSQVLVSVTSIAMAFFFRIEPPRTPFSSAQRSSHQRCWARSGFSAAVPTPCITLLCYTRSNCHVTSTLSRRPRG